MSNKILLIGQRQILTAKTKEKIEDLIYTAQKDGFHLVRLIIKTNEVITYNGIDGAMSVGTNGNSKTRAIFISNERHIKTFSTYRAILLK